MRPQPLIAVHDVEASSRWYQQLSGARATMAGRTTSGWWRTACWCSSCTTLRWKTITGRSAIPNDRPYGNGVLAVV